MEEFLDLFDQLKLKHEGIKHLNKSITSKEIETVIENFPIKKSPGSYGFAAEFCQTLKEELIPTPFKLFHEI
jgi:hypothetical protein